MAKLSELLTGDQSTWRRVRCEQWKKGKFFKPLGFGRKNFVVGIDEIDNICEYMAHGHDWQYYEESKPNGYVCAPYAEQHIYINSNDTCQCGRQKRLVPDVTLTDYAGLKPKVTRWLWAIKNKDYDYWSYTPLFLTDQEAEKEYGDWDAKVKLLWTETEFSE